MLLIIVFGGIELLFLKLCYNKLLKPELLGLHLGRELRRAGVNLIRLPFLYLAESFSKGIGREREQHQEIHIEMEKAIELFGMEFIIILSDDFVSDCIGCSKRYGNLDGFIYWLCRRK